MSRLMTMARPEGFWARRNNNVPDLGRPPRNATARREGSDPAGGTVEGEVGLRCGFRKHGLVLTTGEIKATFEEMAQGPLVTARRTDRRHLGLSLRHASPRSETCGPPRQVSRGAVLGGNHALTGVSTGLGAFDGVPPASVALCRPPAAVRRGVRSAGLEAADPPHGQARGEVALEPSSARGAGSYAQR